MSDFQGTSILKLFPPNQKNKTVKVQINLLAIQTFDCNPVTRPWTSVCSPLRAPSVSPLSMYRCLGASGKNGSVTSCRRAGTAPNAKRYGHISSVPISSLPRVWRQRQLAGNDWILQKLNALNCDMQYFAFGFVFLFFHFDCCILHPPSCEQILSQLQTSLHVFLFLFWIQTPWNHSSPGPYLDLPDTTDLDSSVFLGVCCRFSTAVLTWCQWLDLWPFPIR